ncbi:imidazole glycerol phosphate synthase subunit HisH [Sphingorhabdus sp.]|uniref:imidazole glycerol phosphate synthase subunit HisH n=1 Tax=Sphingorhabdus sp. TaxID=1902408 RepID=UPI0035B170FA
MRSPEVVVIDYGMGNLLSVQRGLEHVGAQVFVSSSPERIRTAERVVLPGVGAFPDAMKELARRELVSVIPEIAARGTPLLGICLGMQVLFETGAEFGETAGLAVLPGSVVEIPAQGADGQPHKIPHVGWNALRPSGGSCWKGGLLTDVAAGEAVYFVHSFMAQPRNEQHRIADCYYGGIPLAAVVGAENVVACQFHPEKSGDVGLRILRQFLSL